MAPETLAAMGLEWEQMSINTSAPLPRKVLNRGTVIVLSILRVYVIVAVPVVVFAFVRALAH